MLNTDWENFTPNPEPLPLKPSPPHFLGSNHSSKSNQNTGTVDAAADVILISSTQTGGLLPLLLPSPLPHPPAPLPDFACLAHGSRNIKDTIYLETHVHLGCGVLNAQAAQEALPIVMTHSGIDWTVIRVKPARRTYFISASVIGSALSYLLHVKGATNSPPT